MSDLFSANQIHNSQSNTQHTMCEMMEDFTKLPFLYEYGSEDRLNVNYSFTGNINYQVRLVCLSLICKFKT